MNIDLCVFLAGNKLEEYTPLFLETLLGNCDMTDVSVHVIEKGTFPNFTCESGRDPEMHEPVGKHIHDYLIRKMAESSTRILIYDPDPSLFFANSGPYSPYWKLAEDHANTLNWAMANCGESTWVIFCHSDMIFKTNAIGALRKELQPDVGLYGIYNHFYAVNREAFRKVGVKFNSIPNLWAIPVQHSGFDYEIRHGVDPASVPGAKRIYGWDVGELLELAMTAHGWRCDISNNPPETLSALIDHLCSGHEYTTNEWMIKSHQDRRDAWMEHYGIKRIEA